jgi:hypothetical protein
MTFNNAERPGTDGASHPDLMPPWCLVVADARLHPIPIDVDRSRAARRQYRCFDRRAITVGVASLHQSDALLDARSLKNAVWWLVGGLKRAARLIDAARRGSRRARCKVFDDPAELWQTLPPAFRQPRASLMV